MAQGVAHGFLHGDCPEVAEVFAFLGVHAGRGEGVDIPGTHIFGHGEGEASYKGVGQGRLFLVLLAGEGKDADKQQRKYILSHIIQYKRTNIMIFT